MRDLDHATAPLLRDIARHARSQGDRIAIRCGDTAHDYAKLVRRFERVTAHLAGTHGVRAGQRVATLAANDDLQLVILLACLRLGAIWAPLDPLAAPDVLARQVQQADADLMVTDDVHRPALQALGVWPPGRPCVLLERLIDHPAPYGQRYPDAESGAPVLLLFDAEHTGKTMRYRQDALLRVHTDLAADDNVLVAQPLARFTSLMLEAVPALARGATVTLLPEFTAGAWLAAVTAARPTVATVTVAMMEAIQRDPRWLGADFTALRRLSVVGGAPAPALAAEWLGRGLPLAVADLPVSTTLGE